ncbi:MAG: hypothetical protein Terrestrivirus4_154 [Terrestrivirus sp.]|jgi:hypothetical protein|uniref:Uncharacterized protein n=1 Tax=Terrestrivirus sp. TaxID=2487775 RepID=A0A3G4ZMN4_9VIRU|nr:MAG: hypothetical protein Terrestrivirus4_154 [Terrestrivirus sp.]
MKVNYLLTGGCGTTKVQIDMSDENEFKMEYYSHWMGSEKKTIKIKGTFANDVSLFKDYKMYSLHPEFFKLNDANYPVNETEINLSIIILNDDRTVIYGDDEDEGIVMGGVLFNNGDRKYNAILHIKVKGQIADIVKFENNTHQLKMTTKLNKLTELYA